MIVGNHHEAQYKQSSLLYEIIIRDKLISMIKKPVHQYST
jgi:hypothetical protein